MDNKNLNKKRKQPSNNIDISKNLQIKISKLNNPPYLKSTKSPKIISFYAEKGGVGKTTMCITLAHVFAAKDKKVLIYDCDVQRSLTAWLLGNNFEVYRNEHPNEPNPFDSFLTNKFRFNSNIFARSLKEQVDNDDEIKPAYAIQIKENLFLVQGSRELSSVDDRIATEENFNVAMTNMGMTGRKNDYTGKLYHSIMKTAQAFDIDFVFLDMNPYPGNLNRCLIMCSNYFVIPVCLDYFCQEMLFQMRRNITQWDRKISSIIQFTNYPNALYPWPNHKPKLIGFIPNMFSNTREINTDEIDEAEDANWINRNSNYK
jgi:chromosome partitioning protein